MCERLVGCFTPRPNALSWIGRDACGFRRNYVPSCKRTRRWCCLGFATIWSCGNAVDGRLIWPLCNPTTIRLPRGLGNIRNQQPVNQPPTQPGGAGNRPASWEIARYRPFIQVRLQRKKLPCRESSSRVRAIPTELVQISPVNAWRRRMRNERDRRRSS